MTQRNWNITDALCIALSIGLIMFVITKASVTSFTHDESFTYLHFPQDAPLDILSFKQHHTNNHVLNSLFMKYSEMLFGTSEWSLRLPNVLLFLVYLLSAFLLTRRMPQITRIATFTLLCANPWLIDLFGLARGYGMSFGFMLLSIWFFLKQLEHETWKWRILFHLTALLAALSNFTLLIVYLGLVTTQVGITAIQLFVNRDEKQKIIKNLLAHLPPFILSGLAFYEPIRRLVQHHTFDFGGRNGFFEDTVYHLVHNTLHQYQLPDWITVTLQVMVIASVLIPLWILDVKAFVKRESIWKDHPLLTVTTILLTMVSAIMICQHLILSSAYPIGRFSMFLYPIFMLHVAALAVYLSKVGIGSKSKYVLTGFATLAMISFVVNQDLKTCAEWGYDANTKDMILVLEEHVTSNHPTEAPIELGVHWMFEPTVNFYRVTKNLSWLEPVKRDGLKDSDHYFYVFQNQSDSLDHFNAESIQDFEASETILAKNPAR